MFEGILIILLFLGVALISRSVTTLVHELGHAIPSLLFTKEEVIVCVGSYGDVSNSLKICLGRLRIFLKFNFLAWNLGLCSHQGTSGFWKTLILIIGGPVASLVLALSLVFLIFTNNYSDVTIVVLTFFILSSIWDFAVNIYPISTPFYLFNGSEIYNDGYLFLSLIKHRNYPEGYYSAMEFSINHEYEKAVTAFKKLLDEGFDTREVNDQIISNLMKKGAFEEALNHFGSYKLPKKLKHRDYFTLGSIYFHLKKYEDAIKCLNKAIHKDFQNVQYLNKRGLCFTEIRAHKNAFRDFNAAIYYNPNYLLAYLGRGYSKLLLNDLEGAHADIREVIEFDDEIPESYVYLGFYYNKKGEYQLANENFEKAKAMNADYHGLDFMIEENKTLLERSMEN
jgi:hypothetical protein